MKNTSNPPILFIVEGKTDKRVVPHFFEPLNVSVDGMHEAKINYEGMNGWKQFGKFLAGDSKETGYAKKIAGRIDNEDLKCLIILVDGDDATPEDRAKDLVNTIKENAILNKRGLIPSEEYQCNTLENIVIGNEVLHFGIYILKSEDENNKYSDLESLVLNNSKEKRPKHFDLVDKFTSEFLEVLKDDAPAPFGDLNKARWHIYLALCKETKGLGVDKNKLYSLLPECFSLSLETDNMNVLKQCYDELKRIMNQDITVNENA
ncbi:MAG: DUF3226 domain-containing protein [Vampirovibrionales bacterium]